MAGFGLTQAVQNYQQGVEWRQGQEQKERLLKTQATRDAADQAAAAEIEKSQAEFIANGGQGTYQPNDMTMFKAAGARGAALAKAADWEGWAKNEAALQAQRQRVRSGAWQQFQSDGDVEKLVRQHHMTFNDGRDITAVEKLPGGPANAQKGAPSGPAKLRIKFSDGTTQTVEADKAVKGIQAFLMDPEKVANKEMELNFLRAKTDVETGGKIAVEKEKGKEDRMTEEQKAAARKAEGEAAFKNQLTLADAKGKIDLQQAGISAGATRYSADQRVKAAEIGASKGGDDKGDAAIAKDLGKLQELIIKSYGEQSNGLMGGTRMGSDDTMKQARGVQQLMASQPEMTLADAIAQVRRDFLARRTTGRVTKAPE